MNRFEIFEATFQGDLNRVIELLREDRSRAKAHLEIELWDCEPGPPGLTNTPLHMAALHSRAKIAEALLAAGANSNEIGFEGHLGEATPIVLAAFGGRKNIEVVQVLLAHEADPSFTSTKGVSALSTASQHGEFEICGALIGAGAKIDVHSAARLGATSELAALLRSKPALLNLREQYGGMTPLEEACWHGQAEAARLLVESGAIHTAFSACGAGDLTTLIRLMHKGLESLHQRDTDEPFAGKGAQPLIWAARNNQVSIVQLLLHRGALVDATDWWGYTALDHCAMTGATGAALLLIEAGADVNRLNRGGTPLSRSKDYARDEMVAVLMRHGALV